MRTPDEKGIESSDRLSLIHDRDDHSVNCGMALLTLIRTKGYANLLRSTQCIRIM